MQDAAHSYISEWFLASLFRAQLALPCFRRLMLNYDIKALRALINAAMHSSGAKLLRVDLYYSAEIAHAAPRFE